MSPAIKNITTGKNHAYCSKECYKVKHGDNSTVVVAVKSAIDGVSSRLFTFNGLNPSQSRPSFQTDGRLCIIFWSTGIIYSLSTFRVLILRSPDLRFRQSCVQ